MQPVQHISLGKEMEWTFSSCVRWKPFSILHTHDFHEITIITAGSVLHRINGTSMTVHSNTILYLRPQDQHCFAKLDQSESEYINIPFSEETLHQLVQYTDKGLDLTYYLEAPMPPILTLSSSDIKALQLQVNEFNTIPAEDILRKKAYYRMLIASLFFRMLQNTAEQRPYHPLWFHTLLQKLGEPQNFSRGTSCLEELSGKSMAYLSRIFKMNLHMTPTDYINDLRLNYCAGQLSHTDKPIMDIAMDAGFNNLSHFYHLFRKKYQMSPKKYRESTLFVL